MKTSTTTQLPIIRHTGLIALLSLLLLNLSNSVQAQDIIGRWDLTVEMNDKDVPSWLEVKKSGLSMLVGYFVGDHGSARPVSRVNFKDGRVYFSIPPQWERSDKDMTFEGTLEGDKLTGQIIGSDGKKYAFTGARAPTLTRTGQVVWGEPINIFNGTNLDGWHVDGKVNQWIVENGVLKSPKSGSNLITDEKFNDFRLQVEFRYPAGSNSGIYLRGRYEVQIEDDYGQEPSFMLFAGIYGFLTPNEMAAKPAGEWQAYDITLRGRTITVIANGKKVICEQLIPGITGGAIDSHEGEPGPLMLQGDHGPVEFRKIVLTPAQ
jgi:hypothetical protein